MLLGGFSKIATETVVILSLRFFLRNVDEIKENYKLQLRKIIEFVKKKRSGTNFEVGYSNE